MSLSTDAMAARDIVESRLEVSEGGLTVTALKADYTAERRTKVENRIAFLRLLGVAGASFFYGFAVDRTWTVPWLAWAGLAFAWVYSPGMYLVQLRGGLPSLFASYLASAADGLLLMLWVVVSGGIHSDFFVLMYGAIIAIAFQYGHWQAVAATFLYAAAYVALVSALGQVEGHWLQVLVRVGNLFFIAPLGAMIAREAIEQGRRKLEMGEMARSTKIAEEEAKRSLVLLRKSEELFRRAFQGNLDAISINSFPSGEYREVNEEWLRLTGFTRGEVLGRTPAELSIWADSEDFRTVLHELRKQGVIRNHESSFRVRDGRLGRALFSAMVTEFGGERCVLSFVRDITDLRQAEKELEESRRAMALSEKLSALGTLVSGVAHEIRTPSTYVTNNLFLLRHRLEAAVPMHPQFESLLREIAEYGSAALDGMERINRLVQNLRRFTRRESEGLVAAELHEVVKAALDLFGATQRGRIRIAADLQSTPPIILKREQIEQVVLNLLTNAAEAMPQGGTIRIVTREAFGGAEVEIADEGPGIPPEIQSRLFDPFFTTKGDGTGLGLSIARRIVDAHGGTIGYRTCPGVGTTFVVSLPAQEESRPGENA